MSQELIINLLSSRKERYKGLLPQLKALIEPENDIIANLANICAALKQSLDFFWVGWYLVKDNELVLGPFQGSIACTRIQKGKGVCGTAWLKKEIVLVDNVDGFPGHIACSSESKSEIVLPVFDNNKEVKMVLDVDSNQLSDFNEVDLKYLQQVVHLIEEKL